MEMLELFDIEDALFEFAKYNLFDASLMLLNAMGFPFMRNEGTKCEQIDHFIYFCTEREAYYNDQEMLYLKNIESVCILGRINQSDVCVDNDDSQNESHITFIAVDLKSIRSSRSEDAYYLSIIFNKAFLGPVILLLKNDDSVMFSTYREDIDLVSLSDWFDINYQEQDSLLSLIPACYSYNSGDTIRKFHNEFSYAIARKYIKWPESTEYAIYECFPRQRYSEEGKIYSREELTNIGIRSKNYYVDLYGDDYVIDDKGFSTLEFDDDDLGILEFEELDKFEDNPEQGQELCIHEKPARNIEYDEVNKVTMGESVFDDIDKATLDDPIKLLEWLSQMDEECDKQSNDEKRHQRYFTDSYSQPAKKHEVRDQSDLINSRYEKNSKENYSRANSNKPDRIPGAIASDKTAVETTKKKQTAEIDDLSEFMKRRFDEHKKENAFKDIERKPDSTLGDTATFGKKLEKSDMKVSNEVRNSSEYMKIWFDEHKKKNASNEIESRPDNTLDDTATFKKIEKSETKSCSEAGYSSDSMKTQSDAPNGNLSLNKTESLEDLNCVTKVPNEAENVQPDNYEREKAAGIFQLSKEPSENSESTAQPISIDKVLEKAARALGLENWNEANQIYTEAIKRDSNDYRGWWGLFLVKTQKMQLYNDGSRFIDISDATSALNLAPENAKQHLKPIYYRYLQKTTEVDKATLNNDQPSISEPKKILQKSNENGQHGTITSNIDSILERGSILLSQRKWSEAIEVYSKAIQHDSNDYRGWWGLFLSKTQVMQRYNEGRHLVDTSDAIHAIDLAPENAKQHLKTMLDNFSLKNSKVFKLTFINSPRTYSDKSGEVYIQINGDEIFMLSIQVFVIAIAEGEYTIEFFTASSSMSTTITFEMHKDVTLKMNLVTLPLEKKHIMIEAQGANITRKIIT